MNFDTLKQALKHDLKKEKGLAMGYCHICKKVVQMRKETHIQSIHDQRYSCIKCGDSNV